MDRMLLPHPVQQHHHLDAVVDGDGDVRVLHDGDAHPERAGGESERGPVPGRRLGGGAGLPVLRDLSRGSPGEGAVVPAGAHVDPGGADAHADPVRLVVDGDGAKVGVQFVLLRLLGANQLTVDGQTFNTGALAARRTPAEARGLVPVPLSDTRLRMCPGLELMLKHTSMLLRGRWTMKWGSLSTGREARRSGRDPGTPGL